MYLEAPAFILPLASNFFARKTRIHNDLAVSRLDSIILSLTLKSSDGSVHCVKVLRHSPAFSKCLRTRLSKFSPFPFSTMFSAATRPLRAAVSRAGPHAVRTHLHPPEASIDSYTTGFIAVHAGAVHEHKSQRYVSHPWPSSGSSKKKNRTRCRYRSGDDKFMRLHNGGKDLSRD